MQTHIAIAPRFILRDMFRKIPKQDLKLIQWLLMQFGHGALAVFLYQCAYALNLSIFNALILVACGKVSGLYILIETCQKCLNMRFSYNVYLGVHLCSREFLVK